VANKIITVKNNRKGSISVDTVNGLVSMESGTTRSNLEMTDVQVASLNTMANVAILAGVDPDSPTTFLGLPKEADLNVDVFNQDKINAAFTAIDNFAAMISAAAVGNSVLSITSLTTNFTATSEDFEHSFTVKLLDSNNRVHTWYNADLAVTLEKSSVGGVVSVADAAPPMVGGECTFIVSGTGAWLAGTKQVDTVAVVGTVSTVGDASVVITPAVGDPITVKVPVTVDDTAAVVAGKIRTSLSTNGAVAALFTISGIDANVVFTAVQAAANAPGVGILVDNDTCVGLTQAASTNTAPGVAPDSYTVKIGNQTVMGAAVAGVNRKLTVVEA